MPRNQESEHNKGDVAKGLVAGLIGGLVASWTMNRFQDVWAALSESSEQSQSSRQGDGREDAQGEQQANGGSREQAKGGSDEEQDDATVKAASAISEGIFDHKLTKSEKKIAGPAVHYAFGTMVGGLYGAVTELAPEVSVGAGLPFGTAFWLAADETAVPLLGLSKGPTEYPLSTHVYALASHFVYGLTAEFVRRAVRNAL
jgi:putative membrane protein